MLAALVLGATLTPAVAAPAAAARSVAVMDGDDLQAPDPNHNGLQHLGIYYIRNAGAVKCLDAPLDWGGGNNVNLALWTCNGGSTLRWEVFYYNRAANPAYRYYFRNVRFNTKCVDYPASSGGANGFRFNTYDCVYGSGQMFSIGAYNPNRIGRLLSVQLGGANNVMDAFANGGTDNGRPVGNWAWTGDALQHWYFDRA